jgi:uncharacterized protein (DUF849 family)
MNHDVIISCAVTGDDTKVTKSPHCAVTPAEIAATAIAAAQAGAAIVHIHVREPETGAFSMETKHYREVVKRIRESKVDVIVNLTCGMGGYIVVGDHGLKDTPGPGSDFVSQEDRMRHVIDLCHEGLYRPDIATLDCGSLNFGDGNRAYVSTPNYLRQGAGICKDLGVKPELEVFDTGNLWFVRQMVKEGLAHRAIAHSIVHGHSLWSACRCGSSAGDGQHPARELQLGQLRNQPHADALGGAVGAARRQCARRARGQSVLEQGRVCQQCAIGGKSPRHHRGPGSAGADPCAGAREAATSLSGAAMTELPIYRAKIEPQWIDFNGHLRDAYYGLVASYAIDDLMDFLGLDAAYRARTHCTLYTLELHLHFLHEVKSTDDLQRRVGDIGFRPQENSCRVPVQVFPRQRSGRDRRHDAAARPSRGQTQRPRRFPKRCGAARNAEAPAAAREAFAPGIPQDRIEAPLNDAPMDIHRLIAPRSIALVGAGAWTDAVAAGNLAIGYSGELWRVHPTRAQRPAPRIIARWPSFPAFPTQHSSPFPITKRPASPAPSPRAAAGGFVCFSAGFSETGTESGHRLTRELEANAGGSALLWAELLRLRQFLRQSGDDAGSDRGLAHRTRRGAHLPERHHCPHAHVQSALAADRLPVYGRQPDAVGGGGSDRDSMQRCTRNGLRSVPRGH